MRWSAGIAALLFCMALITSILSYYVPSPFGSLVLTKGMTREAVEELVAQRLNRTSTYNPFSRGAQDRISYTDGLRVLTVHYDSGTISYWLARPDGKHIHVHGRDAEILDWRVERLPPF